MGRAVNNLCLPQSDGTSCSCPCHQHKIGGRPDLHQLAQPQQECWDEFQRGHSLAHPSNPFPSTCPQLVGCGGFGDYLSTDDSCEAVSVGFLSLLGRRMTSPALAYFSSKKRNFMPQINMCS